MKDYFLTAIIVFLMLILTPNCAWVIHTREEIDRPPIDLAPLPESLLVLPDSSYYIDDPILWFQIQWRLSYDPFKSTKPVVTYAVYTDGSFIFAVGPPEEQRNDRVGCLNRSEIQSLIFALNDIGFFRISEDRSLYEYFDVEKTYLFGFVIKTKRQLMKCCLSAMTYDVQFGLKKIKHHINYRGLEGVTKESDHFKELQILKEGVGLIETFFENKIREFSEKAYLEYDDMGNKIIPACSLDEQVSIMKKFSTLVPLWRSENMREDYTVIIKMLVGPDGHVIYGVVQETSGNRYFDYKALEHSKRVKFTPPKYHGDPVCSWKSLPFSPIIGEP